MKSYTLILAYENLDNFLGTYEQASMDIRIKADNCDHAYLLAHKLTKIMEADYFILDETVGELK